MKRAYLALTLSAFVFAGVVALHLFRPPNLSSSDPDVARLEAEHAELLGYATEARAKAAEADAVLGSLWSPASLDAFLQEMPKGWSTQRLTVETKAGVQLCRYAFSKDSAQLRDYPEFVRVLKKLEERPSTRIEAVNLVLNQDGQRFATALITATLPLPFNPEQK